MPLTDIRAIASILREVDILAKPAIDRVFLNATPGVYLRPITQKAINYMAIRSGNKPNPEGYYFYPFDITFQKRWWLEHQGFRVEEE